jgi:hypothetical protein
MNPFFPFAPTVGVILFLAIFLLSLSNTLGAMIWWELREMRKRGGLMPLKKPMIKRRVL